MPPHNVTKFVLLGLTQNPHLQKILFIVLPIFLFTVLAKLLMVITISLSPTLSAPMYFFLNHLSFLDASLTSVHPQIHHLPAVPKDNHLLGCLPDSALYGGHHPHCHGL